MKPLVILIFLFSQVGSAFAGSCRNLEYAELKDTSTERLMSTFCDYLSLAKINGQLVVQYLKVEGIRKQTGTSTADVEREREKTQSSMDECFDQVRKIRSALVNRSAGDPKCEVE